MNRMTRLGLAAVIALVLTGMPGCPPDTGPSQEILDMEQQAFDLVNAQRVAAGLSALVMDEPARAVARAHSEDMVARGFFAHTNPDGKNPFDRMADAGITYSWAGENIAWNNYPDPAQTAVDGWMASTGHRENILRPQYNLTGMGVAADGAGGYYFTQDFIGRGTKSYSEETLFYDIPLAIPFEEGGLLIP